MFIYKRCRCRANLDKYEFTDKQISILEEKLKLLGVKARLELLLMLKKGPHCVCDLITHTKLSQSLISHHLSDLSTAGFVESKKEGTFVEYQLTKSGQILLENLEELIKYFSVGLKRGDRRNIKIMRNYDDQMRQSYYSNQSDKAESLKSEEMSKEELLSEKEELENQLKEVNEALIVAQ